MEICKALEVGSDGVKEAQELIQLGIGRSDTEESDVVFSTRHFAFRNGRFDPELGEGSGSAADGEEDEKNETIGVMGNLEAWTDLGFLGVRITSFRLF